MYSSSLRRVLATLAGKLRRLGFGPAVFAVRVLGAFVFLPNVLAHESHPHAKPAIAVNEAPFWKDNEAAMIKMMNDMAVKPTGDTDRDFAAMMIPHHQGAIDMAISELRYGKNEQLRRIAQGIIVEQMQEIAAMKLAIGQSPTNAVPAPTQQAPATGTSEHHHAGMRMDMSPGMKH